MAAQLSAGITQTQTQIERASALVDDLRGQAARIDRHCRTGKPGVANYERNVAAVAEELKAAEVAHERLVARAHDLAATAQGLDAEKARLERMTETAGCGRVADRERQRRSRSVARRVDGSLRVNVGHP